MSRIPQSGGGMNHQAGDMNRQGNQTNTNGVSTHQRAFLQRDYRQGVAIRFTTDFPTELNGRIDPNAFEYTMKEVNTMFEQAETFDCATFCESCIGFATANLIWWCKDSKYEKCLKRISKFISEQNTRVYLPNGVWITDPVERGLRCIEITIFNEQQRS